MNNKNLNNKFDKYPLADNDISDKRYLPRWEVDNRIEYRIAQNNNVHEARTRDLSCAGVCLIVPEPVPINQKVNLKIYLSETASVDTEGVIVWCKPVEGGNMIGIDFCNTPEEVKEIILNYAFEVKGQDLVNHWFSGWK